MKKLRIALIAILVIIIFCTFLAYKILNTNDVQFSYVLRTFVPESRDDKSTDTKFIIESEADFESFLQKYNIDAIEYDTASDFSKNFFLVMSYYGARPYYTYSNTIKSIKINKDNLQFVFNRDISTEIFANSYIDSSGKWGLAQRYTEVIMLNKKYLKYAKDFSVYSK